MGKSQFFRQFRVLDTSRVAAPEWRKSEMGMDFLRTGTRDIRKQTLNIGGESPKILQPGEAFGIERRNRETPEFRSIRGGRQEPSHLFRIDAAGDVRPFDISQLPMDRQRAIQKRVTRVKDGASVIVNPREPVSRIFDLPD